MAEKATHFQEDGRTFNGGANTDAEGQFVAQVPGAYQMSENMRPVDNAGGNSALVKISGEVLIHGPQDAGANTYRCVGSISVEGRIFTLWASQDPNQFPPLAQINGVTMVKSSLLPYKYAQNIPMDAQTNGRGGLVFDCRSESVPLVFDIGDIIEEFNNNSQAYFSELDIELLQINSTTPIDRPRFYNLQDIGIGGGMKPGTCYYCLRYGRLEGDVTAMGPETGQVYIPMFFMGSPVYRKAGVEGANTTDLGLPTRYGAYLKWRVNNFANYERIELIRIQYFENLGPDAAPKYFIAKKIAVSPGEIGVITYIDDGTGEEFIPTDETNLGSFFIQRAESVRYMNARVEYGNVTLGTKNVPITFRTVNGNVAVPFTKNLGEAGHADPVNNCYYRRFLGGERYGFAAIVRDSAGGRSYAIMAPGMENYQFPNRRNVKAGDSLALSDAPIWAANSETGSTDRVTETFEVADHDTATGKPDLARFVNIMTDGGHLVNAVPPFVYAPHVDGPPYEDGVYLDQNVAKTSYLKPFRPTKPTDTDKFGFTYRVNEEAGNGFETLGTGDTFAYDPQLFQGVNNHTMGIGFYGLENIPPGASGFEIVRSVPARRILIQALACWKVIPGSGTASATKSLGKLVLVLPELESGLMSQEVLDIITTRPQDTKLQVVSPVGFCTEVLGGAAVVNATPPGTASLNCVDMISYARAFWDGGQINPTNASGGVEPIPGNGAPGTHYVDYGSWRNTGPFGPWHQPGNNGDFLIGIDAATLIGGVNGDYVLEIDLDQNIYAQNDPGSSLTFSNPATRDFHEPWYVVNIVQDGVKADNENGFVTCNHWQKFKSTIGIYTGVPGQLLELIDEREDDVWSNVDDAFRYIWVDGQARIYSQNLTINLTTILNDIANNGFWLSPDGTQVYGLYEVENIGPIWYVRIIVNSFMTEGDIVEVRYNNQATTKVYGDCVTQPVALPIINHNCKVDTQPIVFGNQSTPYQLGPNEIDIIGQTLRLNGMPVPFTNYRFADRFYVPFGLGWPNNSNGRLAVNAVSRGGVSTVRQWMVLFDCEMRGNITCLSINSRGYTFPQVNYIPKPVNFDPNGTFIANGIFDGFDVEYPYDALNPTTWAQGGFKWDQKLLTDYTVRRPVNYIKLPEFGFQEQSHLPNAVIWSEKDTPTLQNAPGLRTFPSTNIYHTSNDVGAIQFLWSAGPDGSSGNLYAIMDGGICELMINKNIMYSADGQSVGLFQQGNFIGEELWPSKHVGMPGKSYATVAEGGPQISGTQRHDALFWSDGKSYYMFTGGGPPTDLAKGRFMKQIAESQPPPPIFSQPDPLPGAGAYDQRKDEAYLAPQRSPLIYSGSAGEHKWVGKYTYSFDDYLYHDGRMYGFRDLSTYLLDEGFRISEEEFNAWVKFPTALIPDSRMFWVYQRYNTWRKPTRVEFFNERDELMAWIDENTPPGNGGGYLKMQDGWGHWVPPTDVSIDPLQPRIQGRVMYIKVYFRGDDKDLITTAFIQTQAVP